MAVVVIQSLDGLSIEEAAVRLFELWGIGKKSRDNGVLVLWSTDDRRVRVEVGYGLEGVLNDGKVGAILDAYVSPTFRAGEFDEGLLAGVDALLRAAREEPLELASPRSESYEDDAPVIGMILLGLLGLLPISVGSLVGFRKWRRYHRRRCPACQMRMTRLGESLDNALLEEGQQAEEAYAQVSTVSPSHEVVHPEDHRPGHHHEQRHGAGHRGVPVLHLHAAAHEDASAHPAGQFLVSSSGGGSSSFGGGRSGGGGASRGY
jgi:uncharacterized membrane protein YgcG